MPIIDNKKMLMLSEDLGVEFVMEICSDFMKELEDICQNYTEINAKMAHKIKGNSGNLGFLTLHTFFNNTEQLLTDGTEIDWQTEWLPELKKLSQDADNALSKFFEKC